MASLGTALTTARAFTWAVYKHVTIAFDGDQAGERATLRDAALTSRDECAGERLGSGQDQMGLPAATLRKMCRPGWPRHSRS